MVGENFILGAYSVLTHDMPDNTVFAGAPAKRICSVEEYIEKNKHRKDYTYGWTYERKREYYENRNRS